MTIAIRLRAVCNCAVLTSALAAALPVAAKDVFMVLSGGANIAHNNYSQYLQAKALTGYLIGSYPAESVWVFFAAGNVDGATPVLRDVYRVVNENGDKQDTWLAGSLPRNRPARKESVLRALRDEILPAIHDGGTLYLFVADHGSGWFVDTIDDESDITLWQLGRDPTASHGWRNYPDERLGVAELRGVFADGLGKGRVVFVMTQCFSGGFHYLAIPKELNPSPGWFTRTPAWARGHHVDADFPDVAGFTSTDGQSYASGCNANVDETGWVGYERWFPESLLGENLITLRRTGPRLASFYSAHVQATLLDRTGDRPYSTSEQYLERWGRLIEGKLVNESLLTEDVRRAVVSYREMMDGDYSARVPNIAWTQRKDVYETITAKLIEGIPRLEGYLHATHQALDAASKEASASSEPERKQTLVSSGDAARLWSSYVMPKWKSSVRAGPVRGLPATARDFELHLLEQDRDYFTDSTLSEVYWFSGYGDDAPIDLNRARDIARWARERRQRILAWARMSTDETVRLAAELFEQASPEDAQNPNRVTRQATDAQPDPFEIFQRIEFHRRVLAAWQFLLLVDAKAAIAKVNALTDLERTPLPPARSTQ